MDYGMRKERNKEFFAPRQFLRKGLPREAKEIDISATIR